MADYRVTWETDVFDAATPIEAAQKARAMQVRPGTIATVFDVFQEGQEPVRVDLTALAQEAKIDFIAREVTAEIKAEMKARERIANNRIAVGSDLHLLEMMLAEIDNLRVSAQEAEAAKVIGMDIGSEDIDALCERLNCGTPAKPEQPTTKVKVWALAWDGADDGTTAEIFLSELDVWTAIVDKCDDADKEVKAMLEAEDFEGVSDWLKANIASLDTYNIDEREIDVPVAAPEPLQPAIVPRVVVVVEGGMVSDVVANMPIAAVLIDYDTDDVEAAYLKKIPQGKPKDGEYADACGGLLSVGVDPARTMELWKAVTGDSTEPEA